MARTAVPYSNLTANGSIAQPAGTALNAGVGNGHTLNDAVTEETVFRVTNTGTEGDITLLAGDNPPALAAGLGDLVVTVPATTGVVLIGPVESGRFMQSDGTVLIDVETGMAGTITALRVPRTA